MLSSSTKGQRLCRMCSYLVIFVQVRIMKKCGTTSTTTMISKLLKTDVLAIRCIDDDLILIGIGGTLHVFQCPTFILKVKKQFPYSSNIHGIVKGKHNQVVAFGANSMCIYAINRQGEDIELIETSMKDCFEDWIIALEWLIIDNHEFLIVLFAHNFAYIYNLSTKNYQKVTCEKKCILYGGSIFIGSNNLITIFSGTVFQEILIWNIESHNNCESRVVHRLKGHNGVIFSVIYDPSKRLVCSTSDDRTVRLWGVTSQSEDDEINWKSAKIIMRKTMFGHTARVWRSIIVGELIITIGEDSQICKWSIDGQLIEKIQAHHGAAIWSIDTSKNNNRIYTGAADGSVYVWTLQTNDNSIPTRLLIDKKVPKYISYSKNNNILIFYENGELDFYEMKTQTIKVSVILSKYSNYCIMQASPNRMYTAFASQFGLVTICEESRILIEKKIMESKILSLQWLNDRMIIICGINGLLKVFNFTPEGEILFHSEYTLPQSRERWLTSAILYKESLICCDRAGNMHIFKNLNNPIQSMVKVHGKIGIQSCTIINDILMTTGRDGILRFYEHCNQGLNTLHTQKLPMDWISNTLKTSNDVLVIGFKEVEFILYSMALQRVIWRTFCGGGHRSWDCILSNETIYLSYIRQKQVYTLDCKLETHLLPTILNGFHSKQTYSVQPLLTPTNQTILISGGEDGALRMSSVEASNDHFNYKSIGIFNGHLSSIRCINVFHLILPNSCKRYFVFSAGGRSQLKVWEIQIRNNDISCKDLKSHLLYNQNIRFKNKHSYNVDPETRYMDIAVFHSEKILLFVACADGCLRIFLYDIDTNDLCLKGLSKCSNRCVLKVHLFKHDEQIIVLTMGTDGYIRFWNYTKVIDGILKNQSNYDIQLDFFAKYEFHKSGINSLDLKIVQNKYLLLIGGDSNTIGLILFNIVPTSNEKSLFLSIILEWFDSSSHLTQITGVKFYGVNNFFTIGMDQELILHNYKYINDALSVKMVNRMSTSIPDVQGLVLSKFMNKEDEIVYVYGRGLEIISTNTISNIE